MLKFITLSGFLGAGKTTTMTSAAELLRSQGRRVAVITNDAGDRLVDTATASRAGVPVREVTGGCFCCRFDDLAEVTVGLVKEHMLDIVIAEAVGSCTDITATVIRPLRRFYNDQIDVAPLTTVVDPSRYLALGASGDRADQRELGWLMHKQLEDAEIIAINKVDVTPADRVEGVATEISRRYPNTRVRRYSAATGDGIGELLDAWTGSHTPRESTLEIDYQRYGKAEALLGWLDQELDITASGPAGFDPDAWAERFLDQIASDCAAQQILIGHVKLVLRSDHGGTKASATGSQPAASRYGAPVTFDLRHDRLVPAATAMINARVACSPPALEKLVATATTAATAATSSTARVANSSAFAPAQPKPTHRITTPV